MWLSRILEKERDSLTKRETLWRKVQLKRSIALVKPEPLGQGIC